MPDLSEAAMPDFSEAAMPDFSEAAGPDFSEPHGTAQLALLVDPIPKGIPKDHWITAVPLSTQYCRIMSGSRSKELMIHYASYSSQASSPVLLILKSLHVRFFHTCSNFYVVAVASDAPFNVAGNYAAAGDGGGFLVTFSQDGLEGDVTGTSYPGGEAMPLACEWKVEEGVRYLTFKMEDSEFWVRPGEKDGKDMLLGKWVDDAGDSGAWNLTPLPGFARDFTAEDFSGKWFTPGPGEGEPAWTMDVEKDGENWKGSFTMDGETFAIMMSASEKTFKFLDNEGQAKKEDEDFEPVLDGLALRLPVGDDDGQLWWRSA